MERRITRSHPDYGELFGLANRIAQAKNPQRFFDGVKALHDGLPFQVEWAADVVSLEAEMTAQLEGGLFRDYVETLAWA